MAARATFTNPLPWELEEERGLLVPTLGEQFGGKAFYDATAVKEEDNSWTICAWVSDMPPSEGSYTLTCFNSNDPPGGVFYLPGHPTVPYPKRPTGVPATEGGPNCDCLDPPYPDGRYPARSGLAGWEFSWGPCGPVTYHAEVWADIVTPTEVRWQIRWWYNATAFATAFVWEPVGDLPYFPLVTFPPWTTCPESEVLLEVFPPDFFDP